MVQRECKPCPEADMQWSVYLSALVLPIVMMFGGLLFLFWAGAAPQIAAIKPCMQRTVISNPRGWANCYGCRRQACVAAGSAAERVKELLIAVEWI
jgi:hypothetical protein